MYWERGKGGWGDPNGKLDEHGEDTPALKLCYNTKC